MQANVFNNTLKFDFENELFVISIAVLGPMTLILNFAILISVILIMVKGSNKPKSYIILGNICFANIISMIVEIVITCKSNNCPFEYQPNDVERVFLVSSNMASMWSICFLALDRLVYIVYAIKYNKLVNLKAVLYIVGVTWFIGGFVGLLPKSLLDTTALFKSCNFRVSYLLLIQIITSTFIALVILVTYLSLYIIYQKKIVKNTVSTMKYPFKNTVIAMLSCASFVISWEPFLISMVLFYVFCSHGKDYRKPICKQISTTIVSPLPITSLLNAFFNPTAYIWWHKPFVLDLKHVYCAKKLREQKRAEFIKDIEASIEPYITHL